MTDIVPAPLPPAPRQRRSWLLIVSLCLNIALIPVIAAVVMRAMHRDVQIGSGGILAPHSLMAAFPSDAGKIQKVITAHTPKIRELRHASVQTRVGAWQVLASPNYTPEKMSKALDAVHDADTVLEGESLAMMNDSLAALSPDERTALVEKIKRRNRSWLFRMFRPRPN